MKHLNISTKELAEICGVSQGTVDRALNGRPDIKADTKQKILRVAKEYGYREHIGNDDGIKGTVGIIVFNLNNEYFSKLITELEYVLREMGYGAVVMMTHYDRGCEIECIRNMYNMGVKGIVLFSVNTDEEFRNYLKLLNIPIVAVGNNIGGVPFVGIDDRAAMRELTEYVISEGYKELVYFSPALKYQGAYAQRARYEGFLSAASGVKYTIVKDIDGILPSYSADTTVICSTDYYAFQVHFKANSVKTVGFDNLDAIDKYQLNIDSVGYSVPEIARAAADIIMKKRSGDVFVGHCIVKRPKCE